MTLKIPFVSALLLAAASLVSAASPMGTSFSYQGRLQDGAQPATGSYDFRFAAFDAAAGGAQVGPNVDLSAVAVNNGLFTVALDFGTGIFDGSARWLAIQVKTNGAAGYAALTPRQPLSPAPYSMLADRLTAGAGQAFTGPVNFNPASGPPFTVGNTTLVPNLNADYLDGLHASAFVLRVGDVMSGSLTLASPATLDFGSTTRQMLNLWGASYGIGVQSDAQYYRSFNDFAWYRGGVHNNAHFDSGGGQTLMTLTTNGLIVYDGYLNANRLVTYDSTAGVIGASVSAVGDNSTAVLGKTYSTRGPTRTGDTAASIGVLGDAYDGTGVKGTSENNDGVVGLLGTTSKSRGIKGGVYAESRSVGGNGLVAVATNGSSAYAVWAIAPQGYAGYFEGKVTISGSENVGGTLSVGDNTTINFNSGFDTPQLRLRNPAATGFARARFESGSATFWDVAVGGDNTMRFFNNGNGDVMVLNTNGQLYVNVLTIRGGADIAEPFQMSSGDLPKGSVVVIDEANPGHLKMSQQAYDTRVAGVISGANGVKPGLSLRQEGLVDGDQQVALTGRVYVRADASQGAIKPGDLLTTAASPGCAMKVADHSRAQGAILGKAMTGLESGQGYVLVLVTLQ
jgi:hypothetical protein